MGSKVCYYNQMLKRLSIDSSTPFKALTMRQKSQEHSERCPGKYAIVQGGRDGEKERCS